MSPPPASNAVTQSSCSTPGCDGTGHKNPAHWDRGHTTRAGASTIEVILYVCMIVHRCIKTLLLWQSGVDYFLAQFDRLHGRFAGGRTELLDDVFEDRLVALITETKGGR